MLTISSLRWRSTTTKQFYKDKYPLETFIPVILRKWNRKFWVNNLVKLWLYRTKSYQGAESFLRLRESLSCSRNSLQFMSPQGSLPHSQQLASAPEPEPHVSSPHFHNVSLSRFILILPSNLSLGLPNCLFPSDFPTNFLHAFLMFPMRKYPAHLL